MEDIKQAGLLLNMFRFFLLAEMYSRKVFIIFKISGTLRLAVKMQLCKVL
jgi:hypothetical protein